MSAAGVTRSGLVEHRDQTGSPGVGEPRVVAGRLVTVSGVAGPFTLSVATPGRHCCRRGPRVGVRAGHRAGPRDPADPIVASRSGDEVSVPLSLHGDGSHRFSLELPAHALARPIPGDRMWGLRVDTSDGVERVAWPEDTPDAWLGAGTASEFASTAPVTAMPR